MKHSPKNPLAHFSGPRPDPVLAEAGVAGELFVAKLRIGLASILLLIPLINAVYFPVDSKENLVGIGLTFGIFVLSVLVYWRTSREFSPSWLSCQQQL